MSWRHSGFSVDNSVRISEKDEKGRESIAHSFSEGGIPKKSFQMTRYYGWYSNRSRGERQKSDIKVFEPACGCMPADKEEQGTIKDVEIIDVSKYQPKKVPSLKWRECIKKIWKDDPLSFRPLILRNILNSVVFPQTGRKMI